MNRHWIAACLALRVLGCKAAREEPHPTPPTPASVASGASSRGDDARHAALPKRLTLSARVIADAKIRTQPVTREALPEGVTLPGEVAADPDRLATVASPVSGRLASVRFREGSIVKKGEILALLQVPDLIKAKADAAASAAHALAARDNAQRLAGLSDKGLASSQELLEARSEASAQSAHARAASELLRAIGSTLDAASSELPLRAPIAGTVIARNALVGQAVAPEQSLATIAELSEALFLARVFEMDLERVRVGAAVEVRLNAYAERPFSGVVEYIGRQVDPNARTLTARIRLKDDQSLLRVGLFGSAFVQVNSAEAGEPVLVVPQSAVVSIAEQSLVFVVEGEHDFLIHEVTLGTRSLGKVRVVSGLREGERVVFDGAFTLKSLALKSTFGEDE